ncbi:ankyrin repeat domain-containing protein [Wolbachia endosymbiont of Tribolium confusum]|nr:ankyrin repeat domain-containing protein [Wolbachia endosymbiont of Tribolium confusum]MCA7010754.1 ankyrin repeat domain-containing protein [Wolbachia endosymbiont of Tribolium confusum]
MTYEQWNIILGVIDQEVNLSKDNVIERIKERLKEAKILGQAETSRMLEEISHGLEVSSESTRVQETQEPLKKRLKVVNVLQTKEKAKKRLKESRVPNAQQMVKRMLKKLGVQETSEEPKAVALEDVLNARKISERVPVMLDARRMLETLEALKRASGNVYREWEEDEFDINHWFTVNCFNECFPYTLLYLAIDFKLNNVINAMLEVKEININAKGPFSAWSALHWAAETGNIEVTLKLLQKGANVDQLDSSERTALHWATEKGDIEITEILVKNKADVNAEDLAKLTALYEAARNGHKEVVKILMANGADAKRNGTLKLTPLHIAVANNNEEMVVCLIKMDKNISENIEAVDVFGWTPLYWAAAKNDTLILFIVLEAMLKCGANVNIEDNLIGRSPLHIAAVNGNVEAVKLLIYYGAEVNYKDAWGWTPFNCAAARGNIEIINCLIANGANIETNDLQKISLSICPYNYLEAATTIIQLGIWKDVMKLMGAEFLRCAAGHGDTLMVHALLEAGVKANTGDDLGSTALHKAAKYNHPEVVRILILYGANVNAQNGSRESPLTYAVERRNWIVVITLLCYGANPSLPDNCYETVRDLAERQGISNLLVEAEQIALAIRTQLDLESSIFRNRSLLIVQHISSYMLRVIELHLSISFEFMVRGQANQIEQLQYNAKLNEKGVTLITDRIQCMQLETNTKACPAEMDGVKEQILHSPCRWSYRTKNVNVGRVTPLANGIARMQLEPSTKMNRIKKQRYSPYRRTYHTTNVNVEKATPLANNIEYTKLEPNTEACSGPNTHLSNIEKLLLMDSRPSPIIAKY